MHGHPSSGAAGSSADARRYPRLAEYLARLPAGSHAYPECTSRGTLVTSALVDHDVAALPPGLPDPVLALISRPPLPGAWVPAVHSDAVFYAMVDTFHPDADKVLRWTRERTLRTANSPMYRTLTRVAGPSMILRIASSGHGMFQRGTEMRVRAIPRGMVMRLEHPAHLHGGLNHLSNVAMIETLLGLAGSTDVRVEMTVSAPTHAEYHATWA